MSLTLTKGQFFADSIEIYYGNTHMSNNVLDTTGYLMSIYEELCEIATEDRVYYERNKQYLSVHAEFFCTLLREHLECPDGLAWYSGSYYPLVCIRSREAFKVRSSCSLCLLINMRDTLKKDIFHPFLFGIEIFPYSKTCARFEIGGRSRNKKFFTINFAPSLEEERKLSNLELKAAFYHIESLCRAEHLIFLHHISRLDGRPEEECTDNG